MVILLIAVVVPVVTYENKEYTLSVGIGYERLMEKDDSFQRCIQRADEKLYLDKEKCKKEIGGD